MSRKKLQDVLFFGALREKLENTLKGLTGRAELTACFYANLRGKTGLSPKLLLVILCTGSIHRPLEVLRYVLNRLDLRLNEQKTRIVNAYKESFDFLGFSFCLRQSRKTGKLYPHVEPSRRSVQRIKDRMKALTDRRRTPIPLPILVEEVNMSLRGWSGYFHYRNCTQVFGDVKWHVEERVRTHLRRRFKLHSRAQARRHLPSAKLYGSYNLFKLPTTAAWRKAHAL